MRQTLENYAEHLGSIDVHGWRIPFALTLPSAGAATLPSAILLIPGSLFSDVNGDYPSWNSFPHVYAHLARQLSEHGHAVFRFAKLGPGTGSVVIDEGQAATMRTWAGRLVIADAAFDAMRREVDARHVAVERMIVAGHSEGSVVASQLAASSRADEIDGVVLLAGPSVGLLEIMREQTRAMTPLEELDATIARLDAVIACIRRGEIVPVELATGPGMGATALAQMPAEARRYMRDTDATDPLELARALMQPVLVVQAGGDDNVPAERRCVMYCAGAPTASTTPRFCSFLRSRTCSRSSRRTCRGIRRSAIQARLISAWRTAWTTGYAADSAEALAIATHLDAYFSSS